MLLQWLLKHIESDVSLCLSDMSWTSEHLQFFWLVIFLWSFDLFLYILVYFLMNLIDLFQMYVIALTAKTYWKWCIVVFELHVRIFGNNCVFCMGFLVLLFFIMNMFQCNFWCLSLSSLVYMKLHWLLNHI